MPRTNIDSTMSVFSLVENDQKNQQMLNNVWMMNHISREIENIVIKDHVPARIFSSFQRITSFMPQIKRYQHLAQYAESVHVFAHFDITPPPIVNVNYVPLRPDDQLAKEWFVIADAPDFFTALVTEEVDSVDDPRAQRMFKGFWSFDEELVTIIQEWLSNLNGMRGLNHVDQRTQRNYRKHISLMANMVNRMTAELSTAQEKR